MPTNPSIETLSNKLKEIEALPETDENQIHNVIRSLNVPEDEKPPCDEFLWELYAFAFCEKGSSVDDVFGPRCAVPGEWEFPSQQQLNVNTITYWKERAKASTNPVFRARYAELVWVFGKTVKGKADASCVPIFVEAVLEMVQNDRYANDDYGFSISNKLARAIQYAISTNKRELADHVKIAMIGFECNHDHVWWLCFDNLLLNKGITLTTQEEKDIITRLHHQFDQSISDNKRMHQHQIATRLADYYRAKNDLESCQDIAAKFCSVMESFVKDYSHPIVAYSCYQKAAEFAKSYQFKDLEEKFLKLIRDTSPQVVQAMQQMSIPMQVDRQELEKFYESFLQGNKDEAFQRIAAYFMRPKAFYTDQVQRHQQQYITEQLFSTQLFNHDGLQAANINPDDEEGKTILEATQWIQYSAKFLHDVLHRAIEKYNVDSDGFVDYLSRCPLFSDNREILKLGFEHYLREDYCSAIHLLIPQIERVVRAIVRSCGVSTLKIKQRDGGSKTKTRQTDRYDQQTRGVLLEDQHFIDFWKTDDVPWYLRVVLTDQRGLNLRNDVCHGLRPYGSFRFAEADLLIHILLVLATCVAPDHA